MTTKYVWIEGIGKWFHTSYKTMDVKYGENFSVDLYLDDATINTLKSLGWRGKLKQDEDGVFAKFSRKNKQQFKTGIKEMGPPVVTMGADKIPFDGDIGNGSEVAILLEVYPSQYGIGTRLNEVLIKNLVEYDPEAAKAPALPESMAASAPVLPT